MSLLLYNVFIRVYLFAISLASLFNPKAKKWLEGRKSVFRKLSDNFPTPELVIWMHCSSLGEFEQGRPLLEKLRLSYPAYKILLTFFSPSGYEIRKNYKGADYVCYLPMDSKLNAKQFFSTVTPSIVLFVKYEFWYYYLAEAKKRSIPLLLVSAVFRKEQPFFKWYGSLHRKMLSFFHHVFVQDPGSLSLLSSIRLKDVTVAGDTRFDRVVEIADQFERIPAIENFCGDAHVIVAGSTWNEDDEELGHFANANKDIKFIIAPHNVDKGRIRDCRNLYKNSLLYSEIKDGYTPAGVNTIIIDNVGLLSRLYKYATICYVGGGFGEDGVHNVLEAAVYYKPVVFGPEYEKFIEAAELIDCGGAFAVENAIQLEKLLKKYLGKDSDYERASFSAGNYVNSKKGATNKIVSHIQANRLLTN